MQKGIVTDKFWLHDHDSWQVAPMEFPEFNGDVAGVEYVGTREWNCGSVYFNENCLETLQYIVDTLEENKHSEVSSDEVIIAFLRRNGEIQNKMISINQRWNVGLTHSNLRLEKAIKPVIVLSFKPDQKEIFKTLENKNLINLINSEFFTILNKHFKCD